MKKVIKIFMIFAILVISYEQFAFADVVSLDFTDHYVIELLPLTFMAVILVVILGILLIIFNSIKNHNENIEKDDNNQKNKVLKQFVFNMIFVGIIIFIMIIHGFLRNRNTRFAFWIPNLILIFAIIFRFLKKKKMSNIIFIIGILVIFVINIYFTNVEIFNKNVLKDTTYIHYTGDSYIEDKDNFINEIINLNENKNSNIILTYDGKNYKTTEELNTLLKILKEDKKSSYVVKDTYDLYTGGDNYINNLTIEENKNKRIIFSTLSTEEIEKINESYYSFGGNQSASNVKQLIDNIIDLYNNSDNVKEVLIPDIVVYKNKFNIDENLLKDNENNNSKYVVVSCLESDENYLESLNLIKDSINENNSYKITFEENKRSSTSIIEIIIK